MMLFYVHCSAALQDHLNNLVDGIQDENNENTKLSES